MVSSSGRKSRKDTIYIRYPNVLSLSVYIDAFKRIKRGVFAGSFVMNYSMPHRLVIFTMMKITKATIRKVIKAPMKCPTRKGPSSISSH